MTFNIPAVLSVVSVMTSVNTVLMTVDTMGVVVVWPYVVASVVATGAIVDGNYVGEVSESDVAPRNKTVHQQFISLNFAKQLLNVTHIKDH